MHHHVRHLNLRALSSSSRVSYLSCTAPSCTTLPNSSRTSSPTTHAPSARDTTHQRRRHYATQPSFGLIPKHIVEKARRSLPPSAVPIRVGEDTHVGLGVGVGVEENVESGASTSAVGERDVEEERAAAKRRRRTEWKRRQGVNLFLLVVCCSGWC